MLININIGKPFSLLNIRILQMNTAVNICTQEHKIISITDNIILLAMSICFVQGEALIVKGRAGYWQMSGRKEGSSGALWIQFIDTILEIS